MRFDETLRGRARANLTSFERRAISVNGRKAAAVAVVLLPDEEGQACLLEIARTIGAARFFAGLIQRGQQHGRQDPNDGDHDQQLNQREAA